MSTEETVDGVVVRGEQQPGGAVLELGHVAARIEGVEAACRGRAGVAEQQAERPNVFAAVTVPDEFSSQIGVPDTSSYRKYVRVPAEFRFAGAGAVFAVRTLRVSSGSQA